MEIICFKMKSILIAFCFLYLVYQVNGQCSITNCKGRGICNTTTDECICEHPWMGRDCEARDYCLKEPESGTGNWGERYCKNGGVCINSNKTMKKWECICPQDYLGLECGIRDPCIYDPNGNTWNEGITCLNGASCKRQLSKKKKFKCNCTETFLTSRCKYQDPCLINLDDPICKNNATCLHMLDGDNPPDVKCECEQGFKGKYCQFRDPCQNPKENKCRKNSTCIRVSDYNLTCKCQKPHWFGRTCWSEDLCRQPHELKGRCPHNTLHTDCPACRNDALGCLRLNNTDYNCNCSSDYWGRLCDFLKSVTIVIPEQVVMENGNFSGIVTPEKTVFEALAGQTYTYYFVVLRHGEFTDYVVELEKGDNYTIAWEAFRPVEQIINDKVRSAVQKFKIPGWPAYFYKINHTYDEGDHVILFDSRSNITVVSFNDTFNVPYQNSTVYVKAVLAPEVKCIPTTKLLHVSHDRNKPVEYKRTDYINIEAEMNFDCLGDEILFEEISSNYEAHFHFEWKLFHLVPWDPAPSFQNDVHAELLTPITEKSVEFKDRTLLEGLYQIECTAYEKVEGVDYGKSDLGFFKVLNSPPQIILDGGVDLTVDGDNEIVLDASQSIDDSFPEESENLEFTWECMNNCTKGPWHGPIATIPPLTFESGSNQTIFLRVRSNHANNQASKKIKLHVRSKASAMVKCVENCKNFNPGDEIDFECIYTINNKSGPLEDISWSWDPLNEISPMIVEDKPNLASVTLPRVTTLKPKHIICTVSPNGLEPIVSKFPIKINLPPIPTGTCYVTPTKGVYLKTKFNITCDPFLDEHVPVSYSYYVQVPSQTELVKNLENKLLFGYDTNTEMHDVYLPYGDKYNDWHLTLVVEVTDDNDLSTELETVVQVSRPPDSEIPDLFQDLILKNTSSMRKKFHEGGKQAALQLQMIALYGISEEQIAQSLSEEDEKILKDFSAKSLLEDKTFMFKDIEQMLDSLHILDHVENRPEIEVFKNVSRVLFKGTALLSEFVHHPLKNTPPADVETLVVAGVDSSMRILQASYQFCKEPLSRQPTLLSRVNHRDVLDYDKNDDEGRDYFTELRDANNLFESEDNDESISDSAAPEVQELAKISHNSLNSLAQAGDAGIAYQGFNGAEDETMKYVSLYGKVLPPNSSGINVTLNTLSPHSEVRFVMSQDVLDVIQNISNKPMDILVTESTVNAFCDDSTAHPQTPFVDVNIKDEETHVGVPLRNLPVPLEISLEFMGRLTKAEKDAGKTVITTEIWPPWDIDNEFQPEFPIITMFLPYNAKVGIQISELSSPTMSFKIAIVKDRVTALHSFCSDDTLVELEEGGLSTEFESEEVPLGANPEEPYLEYNIAILPFDSDPQNHGTFQNFSIVFTRVSCLYRNIDKKFWSEEGCLVKDVRKSNKDGHPEIVTCLCNHASIFAGAHFVIPHTIQNSNVFSDFTLEKLEKNPIVLITICVLLGLYVLGLLICRYLDTRDEKKSVGLTIMADLRESTLDRYYLITVMTGSNLWAGTSSCVCLSIYGSNGRSQVYTLKDKNSTVFRRGAVDTFVVPCDIELGELTKIRIWTDYSGHDPAWYCGRIMIRHIASERKWFFYVNRWLRVTADESTVIIESPATTREERKKFGTRFRENLDHQIENAMLWESLYRYCSASTFTRCQRLSCAFALLMSYLLIDIMAAGIVTEDAEGMFEFGDYTIDLFAFYQKMHVIILTMPFGIIIVGLFRNINPRYIPTLIIWKNVVPATTAIGEKSIFIPTVHGEKNVKPTTTTTTKKVVKTDKPVNDNNTKTRISIFDNFDDDDDDADEDEEEREVDQKEDAQKEDDDSSDSTNDSITEPEKVTIHEKRESLRTNVVRADVTRTSVTLEPDRLSVSSASSFSIPSTDIPMLEGWIEQRIQHNKQQHRDKWDSGVSTEDEDLTDADLFEEEFTNCLDVKQDQEDWEVNNLRRLGRRAMTRAVRDYDPDSFIFKGEHAISNLEKLIDKRILEGRKKPKSGQEEGKQDDNDDNYKVLNNESTPHNEEPPPAIIESFPKKIKKEKKKKEKEKEKKEKKKKQKDNSNSNNVRNSIKTLFQKVGKKATSPWKKVLTDEYLEEIDEELEKEIENREFIQDKVNWENQIALELCLLPKVDRPILSWPWWFIFIAWIVCIAVIFAAAGFTVLFGVHYGHLRSMQWLQHFVCSAIISRIIVQPANAVIITLLVTTFGKKHRMQERLQVVIEDSQNSAFLRERRPYSFSIFKSYKTYGPLNGNEIFRLSIKARRRKELRQKLIRLILCVFLLIPLIGFSHSGHNHYNFGVTKNVRNMLHLNDLGEGKIQFKNEESVYTYIKGTVIDMLFPKIDFNGDFLSQRPGKPKYLSDSQTALIGVPRIRQQRVKPAGCEGDNSPLTHFRNKCIIKKAYKKSTQDRGNYNPFWVKSAGGPQVPISANNYGWTFHGETSKKIRSLSFIGYQGRYDGGGYIWELGRTRMTSKSVLENMKKTRWLDHRTRAIFIEFTLLVPSINKFVDVVLLIEQGPTWTYSVLSWITPVELMPIEELSNKSDEAALISTSFGMILIVLFIHIFVLCHDMDSVKRPGYFPKSWDFWSDVIIILFTIASICVYLMRFFAAKEFSETMESAKHDTYINIQRAASWDTIQRNVFSITEAMVFIKFWKLMMFTDKIFLSFALTIKLTFRYVLAFFFILCILICAFAHSGFFLFGRELWEFSTWGESMVTLMDQILGISLVEKFNQSKPILGRIYSFLFGFVIIFIVLNFVVALLDLGVHEAKEVVHQRRVWLTFRQYFLSIIYRTFPTLSSEYRKKKKQAHKDLKTLPPERIAAMKEVLAKHLHSFLLKSGHYKMKEMQEHCNKVLAGTGYRVNSKKWKVQQKEKLVQEHLEELRLITAAYFKEKLGHDLKPEELKEYAEFNKAIVKLRIQRVGKKLSQLEEKVDNFVNEFNEKISKQSIGQKSLFLF